MTPLTIYLDRAILGRCIICEKRLGGISFWVGSATVTEWTNDRGEFTRDADMEVCSGECLGLYEAGERVPA